MTICKLFDFLFNKSSSPPKQTYDMVFVTHLPAFYKVNLYNALAKTSSVLVIFIAQQSKIRTPDFVEAPKHFTHYILYSGAFEKRGWFTSSLRLWHIFRGLHYKKLVLGGWDLIEFWLLAFFCTAHKNALALESSSFESKVTGWRAYIKKRFLKRIALVFASGEGQVNLLRQLGYRDLIKVTHGVGIFRYQNTIILSSHKLCKGRCLFVGRLAHEKNVVRLLEAFQHLPEYTLTLVGQGPQEAMLCGQAGSNVYFKGHVPNAALADIYAAHDLFILPSLQEPWGLVVEEALYYGLPVVLSNKVGAGLSFVEQYEVGIYFNPVEVLDMVRAIKWAVMHYDKLAEKVRAIDFEKHHARQVQQYKDA